MWNAKQTNNVCCCYDLPGIWGVVAVQDRAVKGRTTTASTASTQNAAAGLSALIDASLQQVTHG